MDRDEVLKVIETAKEHASYKYGHREEYEEALMIARSDIKSMQRLLMIYKGDLLDSEKEQEIRHIIASARMIAR